MVSHGTIDEGCKNVHRHLPLGMQAGIQKKIRSLVRANEVSRLVKVGRTPKLKGRRRLVDAPEKKDKREGKGRGIEGEGVFSPWVCVNTGRRKVTKRTSLT